MIRYRSEVDGLRAVAVVPIVLFHAGVGAIPGGFTGVDVFFVISGFLITSIIHQDMVAGRFSVATFYRRRIVRIVPALVAVLGATLLAGCLLLLPGELRELGRSTAAAAAFGSNIFFWKTSNYFAGAAESKALLHTWSLGVEEQFYIFFPLFLLLLRRILPRHLIASFSTAAAASFLLGAAVEWRIPGGSANFYLLPARAWELLLGGLVALGGFPSVERQGIRTALAAGGLALIGAALFVIGADDGFPIPWALLPAVGAAMTIAYAPGTPVAAALSIRPTVAIGQISYSLYLWHWPIIVFYRLTAGSTLHAGETVALVAASAAAAVASRELIEKPFLGRYRNSRSGPAIGIGLAALALVVAAGLLVSAKATRIRSLPPEIASIASYGDYAGSRAWLYQYRRGPCFAGEGERYHPEQCLRSSGARPNVLVLGDSHAAQYWRAIALAMPDANVIQATASGCRPVWPLAGLERCTAMVGEVVDRFVRAEPPHLVILAGRWRMTDVPGAGNMVSKLRTQGLDVAVIGPTVEYHGDFSQLLARAMVRNDFAALERLRDTEQRRVDRALAPVVRGSGGRYISAYDTECPDGHCRYLAAKGVPMQFDYGHLTLPASKYVIDRALPVLRGTP